MAVIYIQCGEGGEEMKEYYYQVVYSYKEVTGKLGRGMVQLTVDNKINTFGRINDIQDYIKEQDGFESVFIMNLIELEGE